VVQEITEADEVAKQFRKKFQKHLRGLPVKNKKARARRA